MGKEARKRKVENGSEVVQNIISKKILPAMLLHARDSWAAAENKYRLFHSKPLPLGHITLTGA